MENLNAKQVKKALGCHISNNPDDCEICPYDKAASRGNMVCSQMMSEDALALINKQETEYNELYELCESYRQELVAVKADTVRKMQERLKEAPIKVGLPLFGLQTKDEVEDYANELILQMRDAIDQIAKEMLEGVDNG